MSKGFIFTIDSVFALSVVGLLAFSYIAFSSSTAELSNYSLLESQARDYLRLKYVNGINPVPPLQWTGDAPNGVFRVLTGHFLADPPGGITVPSGYPDSISTSITFYSRLCGCATPTACGITRAQADACLAGANAQEARTMRSVLVS